MIKETSKIIYKLSPHSNMRFLNDRCLLLEKDIVTLSSIIFNIETIFRMGKKVDNVKIPISEETASMIDLEAIKNEIERLLNFVINYKVEIEFNLIEDSTKRKRDKQLVFNQCNNICLFSGGVDSLSGIINSKENLGRLEGVFISHGDQPRGVNIVNTLNKKILNPSSIPLHILYAPPMMRHGYSQLRGFLYCLYGAVYVNLMNAKNLLVTECGPTMYQAKFSPFDSVTMTTHPFVLERTNKIINSLLKRKVSIITPYENMTKAEVIIASPIQDKFSYTHSCISLGTGRNCGHCYGCIVRRLGAIVADKIDAIYDYDPITEDYKKGDNLISLLRFSYDVLAKYDNMNFTSKENIFVYKKQRLFRRFALDNFAALYILKQKGKKINPYAENLYQSALKQIGEAKIKERIEQVRSGRFIPNFKKMVIY